MYLLGATRSEYLEKNKPVKVRAVYCAIDILSVGLCRSMKLAPLISHLLIGAQKCTVNGPASAAAIELTTPRFAPTAADCTVGPSSIHAAPPTAPAAILYTYDWTSSFSPCSNLYSRALRSWFNWAPTFVT